MMIRFPIRIAGAYWRLTRGATLGAQGVVTDTDGRDPARPARLPAGMALPRRRHRVGRDSRNGACTRVGGRGGRYHHGPPKLHGIFANFKALPSDHVALFIVPEWERPRIPKPNHEIAESRFFARREVPSDAARGTERRLAEIFDGAPIEPHW